MIDYVVFDDHYLNACTVTNRGAWANETALSGLDHTAELRMLVLLNNFHRSTAGAVPALASNEQYCLFFQVPLDGKVTILRRNEKYILVYLPTDANEHLELNVQMGGFERSCVFGNAIVLTRRTDSDFFTEDHVQVITVEALVDNLIQRRPDRVRRTRTSYVYSSAEIQSVTRLRDPTERRRRARVLATQAINNAELEDFLNLSVSNTQLPVKMGAALPLYSFARVEDLSGADLNYSLALGVSLIPYHESSFQFNESWSWFEPTALLRRWTFEPTWELAGTMVADNPILAWHSLPSIDERLITKLANPNLRLFNPIQSREDDRPSLIEYFVASQAQPIQTDAAQPSNWFQRDYQERHPPAFSPISSTSGASNEVAFNILSANNLLQIKAVVSRDQANVLTAKLATGLGESDSMFNNFIRDFAASPICTTPNGSRIQRGVQINNWFYEKTGYADFIEWFHQSVKTIRYGDTNWYGNYFYRGREREIREIGNDSDARRNFIEVWNRSPLIFDAESVNIFQFLSLINIFINESPRLRPIAEVGDIERFFENHGKQSYNKRPNFPAGDLFYDNATFWEEHGSTDTTPSVRQGSTVEGRNDFKRRWNSETQYPRPLNPENLDPAPSFPNPRQTSNSGIGDLDSAARIIAQADFCKFRGRGLIQTTWRSAYLRLIEFVMNYTGSNAKVLEIKGIWSRYPSVDANEIATRSTNHQWDELFLLSDYEVPCKAVNIFQQTKQNFLTSIGATDLPRLFGRERGSIYRVGYFVGGNENYGDVVLNRTKQMMKALVQDYRRTHGGA